MGGRSGRASALQQSFAVSDTVAAGSTSSNQFNSDKKHDLRQLYSAVRVAARFGEEEQFHSAFEWGGPGGSLV